MLRKRMSEGKLQQVNKESSQHQALVSMDVLKRNSKGALFSLSVSKLTHRELPDGFKEVQTIYSKVGTAHVCTDKQTELRCLSQLGFMGIAPPYTAADPGFRSGGPSRVLTPRGA